MLSPFSSFANAILMFQVPNGMVSINSVGNTVVETLPQTFTAMLSPVRDTAEINYYLGDDDISELLRGYLVNPLSFPTGLTAPIEGGAVVQVAIGVPKTGSFKLLPKVQSPYLVGLGISFLTSIYGVFRRG